MQSRYDGSNCEWHTKEIRDIMTYILEMQSRYNGSDCEWHGKENRDIHSEDAEQVQWVKSRMAWQRDQGCTF
jgi:hypothetical protein